MIVSIPALRKLGLLALVIAALSGCGGDDSTISPEPLWWPPTKLSARYLAPYLSRQTGEAADVMPAPGPRPSSAERPLERSTS